MEPGVESDRYGKAKRMAEALALYREHRNWQESVAARLLTRRRHRSSDSQTYLIARLDKLVQEFLETRGREGRVHGECTLRENFSRPEWEPDVPLEKRLELLRVLMTTVFDTQEVPPEARGWDTGDEYDEEKEKAKEEEKEKDDMLNAAADLAYGVYLVDQRIVDSHRARPLTDEEKKSVQKQKGEEEEKNKPRHELEYINFGRIIALLGIVCVMHARDREQCYNAIPFATVVEEFAQFFAVQTDADAWLQRHGDWEAFWKWEKDSEPDSSSPSSSSSADERQQPNDGWLLPHFELVTLATLTMLVLAALYKNFPPRVDA